LQQLRSKTLGAGLLLFLAGFAQAGTVFDLSYSGAAFGNDAIASGTITLNLGAMNNPGQTDQDVTSFVTDFSLTVSGASAGNGTFDFADYNGDSTYGGFYLETDGGTLDFTSQLVGQATLGAPWGSEFGTGEASDFNIFANGTNPSAPNGTGYFELTTDDGEGDTMGLTSFAPAVPEPALAVPTVAVLLFMAYWARRSVSREPSESRAR
jgi:hypothetical protein